LFDCSACTVDFTEKCWNNLIVGKFSQKKIHSFFLWNMKKIEGMMS